MRQSTVAVALLAALLLICGTKAAADETALLRLDRLARDAFQAANPGLLPELQLSLPGSDATAFDWSDYCRDFGVHNQRDASTCWAHAAMEALECRWAIRNGLFSFFSAQPIIDRLQTNEPNNLEPAMRVLLHHGTCEQGDYRYTGRVGPLLDTPTPARLIAYGSVRSRNGGRPRQSVIKQALLDYGPLPTWMVVTKSFLDYTGGVLTDVVPPRQDRKGGHFVMIVGWDDAKQAWKIKNSWGRKWGEDGYAWISYGSLRLAEEVYWVEAQSMYYPLPADAHASLPEADRFPAWTSPLADAGDPAENMAEADRQFARGNYLKARNAYQNVLLVEHQNMLALTSLGMCAYHRALEFDTKDQKQNFLQAKDRLHTYAMMARRNDPDLARTHYILGLDAVLDEDDVTALAEFNAAITADPKFGPAYARRGELHLRLQQPVRAFNDFDRLIELQPTAENYEFRARQHALAGHQADAESDRQTARQLSTDR